MIFVRETGAIDNGAYRQLNGCDSLKASGELRRLRDLDILTQKGKSRATYYIPSLGFSPGNKKGPLSDKVLSDKVLPDKVLPDKVPLSDKVIMVPDNLFVNSDSESELADDPLEKIPEYLKGVVDNLGKRVSDSEMRTTILALCSWTPLTIKNLSKILNRNEKYLYEFIVPLKDEGKLAYTIPETPNHKDQAYVAVGLKANS